MPCRKFQPSTGLWEKDGALFEAVVTPLGRDFQLVGFMLAGFRINDSMSEQIASLTQTDIVFLQGQSLNPIAMSLVESEREAMTQKAQSLWPSTETLPENAESFIETDINGREVFIAAEGYPGFRRRALGCSFDHR